MGKPDNPDEIRRMRGGTEQTWQGRIWQDVGHQAILDFLRTYTTSENALKARSNLIADFVESLAREGELQSWTVAVMGGTGADFAPLPGFKLATRQVDKEFATSNDYRIGRLLSPRDEAIDLDEAEWTQALAVAKAAWQKDPGRRAAEPEEPNGPAVRFVRGTSGGSSGLLLLYPIDPARSGHSAVQSIGLPIIGIGVSFPTSELGTKIPYSVNNVAWELQYGSAE